MRNPKCKFNKERASKPRTTCLDSVSKVIKRQSLGNIAYLYKKFSDFTKMRMESPVRDTGLSPIILY